MNQTENPLDQLRDIHLPDPINSYMLAPGWWFLLLLILGGLFYWFYQWNRKRKALLLLKPLSQEIETLYQMTPNTESLAKLSELMKRVVIIYYPRKKVAALSGSNWINFLNAQHSTLKFSEEQQTLLTNAVYQKNADVDSVQWQTLVQHCHSVLENIVRTQALSNLKTGGKA